MTLHAGCNPSAFVEQPARWRADASTDVSRPVQDGRCGGMVAIHPESTAAIHPPIRKRTRLEAIPTPNPCLDVARWSPGSATRTASAAVRVR